MNGGRFKKKNGLTGLELPIGSVNDTLLKGLKGHVNAAPKSDIALAMPGGAL